MTVILIFITAGLFIMSCGNPAMENSNETEIENALPAEEITDNDEQLYQPTSSDIKIKAPLPDQTVSSPLLIEGQARGYWFFEADFPIKLLDENGNVISEHYAQAIGDWMTEDFVPFRAELEFEEPDTSTGYLILIKDNPSGLSEHDDSLTIPLRFK
jgi:hypothetical protein